MKRVAVVLLAIVLLGSFPAPALAADGVPAQVIDTRKNIYRIFSEVRKGYYQLGTGFVVAADENNTYVITNYHVVEDAKDKKVEVAMHDGFMMAVAIVGYEEDHDICILKTKEPLEGAAPLILADEETLHLGDRVYSLGFPGVADVFMNDLAYHYDDLTLGQGIISSFKRCTLNDNKRTLLLQTDTPINPGNSGGPLMNSRGEVVGITSYTIRDADGMNAAVSAQHLIELLEENEVAYSYAADIERNEAITNALLAPPVIYSVPSAPVAAVSADYIWGANYSHTGWLLFACIASAILLAGSLLIRACIRRVMAISAAQNAKEEPYTEELQGEADVQDEKKLPVKTAGLSATLRKKGTKAALWGIFAVLAIGIVYTSVHIYFRDCYVNAVQYVEAGAYTPANEALSGIWVPTYRDSASLRRYAVAGSAMQNGEYGIAKELFEGLGAYRNAVKMSLECSYRSAEVLFYDKNYAEAYPLYQELNAYADAADKVRECQYQMALEKTAKYLATDGIADAKEALRSFAALEEYSDANARFEALQLQVYNQGMEKIEKLYALLRNNQLHFMEKVQNTSQEIMELYALLPGYQDCDELLSVMEALQEVVDIEKSYNLLIPHWDVPVAKRILLSNYYLGWHLQGRWAGDGKYFYHAVDTEEFLANYREGYPYYGQANFKRTIPRTGKVGEDVFGVFSDIQVLSGKNYFIENHRLFTGARKGYWRMWKVSYKFEFPDADTIVIIDKDDKEYTLKREKV